MSLDIIRIQLVAIKSIFLAAVTIFHVYTCPPFRFKCFLLSLVHIYLFSVIYFTTHIAELFSSFCMIYHKLGTAEAGEGLLYTTVDQSHSLPQGPISNMHTYRHPQTQPARSLWTTALKLGHSVGVGTKFNQTATQEHPVPVVLCSFLFRFYPLV